MCWHQALENPPFLNPQRAGLRIDRPAWLHPGETTSSGGDKVLQPTGRGAKATGLKPAAIAPPHPQPGRCDRGIEALTSASTENQEHT